MAIHKLIYKENQESKYLCNQAVNTTFNKSTWLLDNVTCKNCLRKLYSSELIRATFIKIQRPLIPKPPKNSYPYFCYSNTLIFKDNKTHKNVWEQRIPEIDMDETFHAKAFYSKKYGWQLEFSDTHEKAKMLLKKIKDWLENKK